MKKTVVFAGLFMMFLTNPFVGAIEGKGLSVKKSSTESTTKELVSEQDYKLDKTKKNDAVDGTTSASQLRAKKSHYVSKKNETILTVSLGIICIGIILFFIKLFADRK